MPKEIGLVGFALDLDDHNAITAIEIDLLIPEPRLSPTPNGDN